MRLSRAFFVLLILAAVAQIAYVYPKRPETMASHFDAAGKANGWMPKDGFIALYAAMLVLMAVMFRVLPKCLLRFPDALINLPNKRYWLAPVRRVQTGQTIAGYLHTVGNATLAFLLGLFQLAFQANLETDSGLGNGALILLVAFLIFVGIWLVQFIRAFRLPPGARPGD